MTLKLSKAVPTSCITTFLHKSKPKASQVSGLLSIEENPFTAKNPTPRSCGDWLEKHVAGQCLQFFSVRLLSLWLMQPMWGVPPNIRFYVSANTICRWICLLEVASVAACSHLKCGRFAMRMSLDLHSSKFLRPLWGQRKQVEDVLEKMCKTSMHTRSAVAYTYWCSVGDFRRER